MKYLHQDNCWHKPWSVSVTHVSAIKEIGFGLRVPGILAPRY